MFLEAQANKFANFLLVPRNILVLEREKMLSVKSSKFDFYTINVEALNSYISGPLGSVFGLSANVVEIALNTIKKSEKTL